MACRQEDALMLDRDQAIQGLVGKASQRKSPGYETWRWALVLSSYRPDYLPTLQCFTSPDPGPKYGPHFTTRQQRHKHRMIRALSGLRICNELQMKPTAPLSSPWRQNTYGGRY